MQHILLILGLAMLGPVLLAQQPLDDITERKIMQERKVLTYPALRESDIFWEKRLWRVVDVREKMNLPFVYPEAPFFNLLRDAAMAGDIQLYDTESDKFTFPLDEMATREIFYSRDTIERVNPVTYEVEMVIVENELNFEDIKRFRIKESWYFDEKYGTLKVRILGIAPMQDVTDDNGNFRFEKPLFWVYYPHCREFLAQQKVFNQNGAALTSWEDIFETRFFASHIYKEANVQNLRLKDYYTGVDRLLEAEKIKEELFNFEHDLWSY